MKRRPGSALEVLNQAIELTRTEPLRANLLAAGPGLFLTWIVLFAAYLELVEGVRVLRPLCALGMCLGFGLRALVLTRYAGRCVDRALAHLPPARHHSSLDTRLRVALGVGAELGLWLWLLAWCARLDPWLCALVAPLFALRGGLWPSWLAAADAAQAGTARSAAWYAFTAGQGQRSRGMLLELMLLLGALALFLNLGALIVAVISLAQDLLGLRLSFVRAFISPRNYFALLLLIGVTLSAFDPLRAAVAAVLHADTRLGREALEVRALVEAAVVPRAGKALAALLCALLLGVGAPASAQTWPESPAHPGLEEECDEACREAQARDDQVRRQLVSILDAPEFRDFALARGAAPELQRPALDDWLERLGRWLSGAPEPAQERGEDLRGVSPVHLPLKLLLAGLGALVLALASLGLWHAQRRPGSRRSAGSHSEAAPVAVPAAATDASPRGRVRSLYLQALERLAERGLISRSSASTNGAYLRSLQHSALHTPFARLTLLFERAQYGHVSPSAEELEEAQALTRALASALPNVQESP